jgi:hypothetical protein
MSESVKQEIETAILRALYGAWAEQGDVSLDTVLEEGKWDNSLFWTVVERMEKRDRLITAQGSWSIYELTPGGVLYAEQKGAPPAEEVERHQMARTEILACLADLYESGGVDADYHYYEVINSTGLEMETAVLNLTFLTEVGYVKDTSSSSFRITHQGLEAVRKWKNRKELGEEFERIETLAPHPRGRAQQKLLAKAIEQSGWSQEEGVRASHEEMDVIIYRDREYYLVECKWAADPVEAAVVRELKGKLDNRVDVRGIVVSMSGFTAGADDQAAEYAGQRVIILFGPEDVRTLVDQERSFEELLNEKYRVLATRRQVIWR